MLHEIFLSLLGFTGDIIVEGEDTYQVSSTFDLFSAAERQQINRLVPLGWYYASLSSFVVFYEVKWGVKMGDPDSQFYRTAMSQGIADVLTEYASDIAYLEQLVLAEGPVPLSHLLHHLQKYLLVMPVIHGMWIEVEKRKIWGCQLLDYIKSKRSGMPVVDDIVQRMMIKVRAVFLKQCLAWMLYGELEDPAEEFFIQSRGSGVRSGDSNSGQQQEEQELRAEMLNRFGNTSAAMWNTSAGGDSGDRDRDQLSFDWNTSFSLRMELLPESHVSPRIASKIMFCGKAVKLLLSANKTANAADMPQLRDIFTYLSKGSSPSRNQNQNQNQMHVEAKKDTISTSSGSGNGSGSGSGNMLSKKNSVRVPAPNGIAGSRGKMDDDRKSQKEGNGRDNEAEKQKEAEKVLEKGESERKDNGKSSIPIKNSKNSANQSTKNSSDDPSLQSYNEYFERCGFLRADIERFTLTFHRVLMEPHMAIQLFESLVEDVHSSLSSKLWILLRDQFGFTNFLLAMRNTFLMGKGEMYQLILDGILCQTEKAAPDSQKADNVLKWEVVRGAGKMLNLDDDSLAATLSLRVNSSNISIVDFSAKSGTVCIAGGAKYENVNAVPVGKKRLKRNISLCTIVEEDSAAELSKLWSTHILKKSSDLILGDVTPVKRGNMTNDPTSEKNASDGKVVKPKYTQGAVWLPDQKYVAKGFLSNAVFECGWSAVKESVTLLHPNLITSVPTILTDDTDPYTNQQYEEKSASSFGESVMSSSTPRGAYESNPRSRLGSESGSVTPRGSNNVKIRRGASGHLLLGGLSCVVHSDRQGTQALGSGDLGLDLNGVVTIGVSFHAHIVEDRRMRNPLNNSSPISTQCYARVFISVKGDQRSRFSRSSNNIVTGSGGSVGSADGVGFADNEGSDSSVVSECYIGIDRSTVLGSGRGDNSGLPGRCLSSGGTMVLEVEYIRELVSKGGVGVRASMTSATLGGKTQGPGPSTAGTGSGLVVYKLRGRIRANDIQSQSSGSSHSELGWDVEAAVDLSHHVKLQGGQAFLGYVGSGIVFSEGTPYSQTERISIGRELFSGLVSPPPNTAGGAGGSAGNGVRFEGESRKPKSTLPVIFDVKLATLEFNGKGALATYPVASLYTSARYPETFIRLEQEVSQFRAWMNLKLTFRFPALFKIIFDSDAMGVYERLFTTIMKVRLVAHALEGLWTNISRSHLKRDRAFCQVRHSMHFFVSNLLFHLQVDVVDSEFCTLLEDAASASDFQSVLRAHRNFLATIMRLSSVDNLVIQEGIERVLQVCLRFIAVCRLLHQQVQGEGDGDNTPESLKSNRKSYSPGRPDARKRTVPVVVPPEEVDGVRKEFFTQMSYLFQIMRKVENRGLMFRLDFNGYLSALSEDMGAGLDR